MNGMAEPNSAGLSHATPHGSGRHEKSLGLLTVKFVNLLQEAKDGVLDLKVAADSLAVKQKRRIYDITNVLEGIGLIEKKTKNTIQWKGERSGCQPQDLLERVTRLKENIAKLELKERELDMQNACLEQNIKHVNEEPSSYQYVTHEDICDAFGGETLLAVMAPSGTQLEVPVPELSHNGQKKYQMNLRSHTAPIQVMLINRETSCSKPVVFSVPPVEDISAMPTPPTTPAGLQRFPVSSSETCRLKSSSLQGHEAEHHLPHSTTSSDMHMECNPESPSSQSFLLQESPAVPQSVHQQQKEMGGQDLQSMLDEMREERGVSNLIDELMSSDVFPLLRLSPNQGVDYNFNLDDNEGVCDLFDVQILNY